MLLLHWGFECMVRQHIHINTWKDKYWVQYEDVHCQWKERKKSSAPSSLNKVIYLCTSLLLCFTWTIWLHFLLFGKLNILFSCSYYIYTCTPTFSLPRAFAKQTNNAALWLCAQEDKPLVGTTGHEHKRQKRQIMCTSYHKHTRRCVFQSSSINQSNLPCVLHCALRRFLHAFVWEAHNTL